MKEIKSDDTHNGWTFSVSSSGIRASIHKALVAEFSFLKAPTVHVGKLTLSAFDKNKLAFKAVVNGKEILGKAEVDIAVIQPKVGEEYASSFVKVSYIE